ncbi:MAG: DUF1491 family protein [Pseudomonadota bacterium]
MTEPRLKSHIRVDAHLRRAQAGGAFATIARKGDADAGAIAVKVYLGGRAAKLFVQSRDIDGQVIWRDPFEDDPKAEETEARVDQWLQKEASIDPDLWIVEIEDREGRAFLEEI